MAEPQTHTTSPQTASPQASAEDGDKARRRANPETTAGNGDERAFAPPKDAAKRGDSEVLGAARDLSRMAAHATREAGEQGRRATRDAASTWRGAVEPFMAMNMEMNRWFEDLWRQTTGFGAFPALRTAKPFAGLSAASMFGLPAADVKETQSAYLLCVELPGLTRDDIEVQTQGDALLISGHKAEEREETGAAYRLSERRFGRFDRSFPIPPDVERDRIEAAVRDGVLTVTLPKAAEAKPQGTRIEIKS